MKRRKPTFTADERLVLGLAGLFQTYEHQRRGEVPPVCSRETQLVEVLEHIQRGDVLLRNVRDYAADALELWRRQAPAELKGADKTDSKPAEG